jgi:hypothetical protein
MIPSAATFLAFAVQRLTQELAPALPDEYLAQSTGLLGAMMAVAAKEADRAVDDLVLEIRQIEILLADARSILGEGEPPANIDLSCLRLTVLAPIHHRLTASLISAHAAIEIIDHEHARALDARIWDYLIASAERRRIDLFD